MQFFPSVMSHEESAAFLKRIKLQFAERGFGLWVVEVDGEFASPASMLRNLRPQWALMLRSDGVSRDGRGVRATRRRRRTLLQDMALKIMIYSRSFPLPHRQICGAKQSCSDLGCNGAPILTSTIWKHRGGGANVTSSTNSLSMNGESPRVEAGTLKIRRFRFYQNVGDKGISFSARYMTAMHTGVCQ